MHSPADAQEDRAAELIPPVSPRAPWRVADVEALPGFRLRVRFNDGIEGTVEMAGFVASAEAGIFAVLRDEKLFRQARIVLGAVTWPGDLDLAPDAMHRAIKEHGIWPSHEIGRREGARIDLDARAWGGHATRRCAEP